VTRARGAQDLAVRGQACRPGRAARVSAATAYVPSSGHVINALAGVVADGSPQAGFNGDGRFARETELSNPIAVAARTNGGFAVAEAGNRRVRKFGPGPR
jgi:hypothetical protein